MPPGMEEETARISQALDHHRGTGDAAPGFYRGPTHQFAYEAARKMPAGITTQSIRGGRPSSSRTPKEDVRNHPAVEAALELGATFSAPRAGKRQIPMLCVLRRVPLSGDAEGMRRGRHGVRGARAAVQDAGGARRIWAW